MTKQELLQTHNIQIKTYDKIQYYATAMPHPLNQQQYWNGKTWTPDFPKMYHNKQTLVQELITHLANQL